MRERRPRPPRRSWHQSPDGQTAAGARKRSSPGAQRPPAGRGNMRRHAGPGDPRRPRRVSAETAPSGSKRPACARVEQGGRGPRDRRTVQRSPPEPTLGPEVTASEQVAKATTCGPALSGALLALASPPLPPSSLSERRHLSEDQGWLSPCQPSPLPQEDGYFFFLGGGGHSWYFGGDGGISRGGVSGSRVVQRMGMSRLPPTGFSFISPARNLW